MKAGVIGLGDMGSGLAKNLIANGYETAGYDVSAERMAAFSALGGDAKTNPAEVGAHACLLYTSPSPRDLSTSRMPSSA